MDGDSLARFQLEQIQHDLHKDEKEIVRQKQKRLQEELSEQNKIMVDLQSLTIEDMTQSYKIELLGMIDVVHHKINQQNTIDMVLALTRHDGQEGNCDVWRRFYLMKGLQDHFYVPVVVNNWYDGTNVFWTPPYAKIVTVKETLTDSRMQHFHLGKMYDNLYDFINGFKV